MALRVESLQTSQSQHPGRWVRYHRPVVGLALVALVTGAASPAPARHAEGHTERNTCRASGTARPALYDIPLHATENAAGASGNAHLAPAPSPFGMSLTPDGRVIYDVTVTASGLVAPSQMGASHYIVWVTTQDLATGRKLAVLGADNRATGQVALDKFIVLITAESSDTVTHWHGPIMLRGFSPSTWLQNFASHPLFLGGMPPC